MKKNVLTSIITNLLLITFVMIYCNVYSQATYTSQADGNWSSTGTWSVTAGSDSDSDGIPDNQRELKFTAFLTTRDYAMDVRLDLCGAHFTDLQTVKPAHWIANREMTNRCEFVSRIALV